ncbi:hypothetical protein OBBRIDRAFT_840339 [Obba rivulosa]|uniref:Uncharacterized protein n=1 Tax=Obba rivulosa TaxID=1052685 RepID=A0A8E2DE80_9APHY|nr:hypothetical protein OBBRIDRAFT_840339 [Obba rivulosa]
MCFSWWDMRRSRSDSESQALVTLDSEQEYSKDELKKFLVQIHKHLKTLKSDTDTTNSSLSFTLRSASMTMLTDASRLVKDLRKSMKYYTVLRPTIELLRDLPDSISDSVDLRLKLQSLSLPSRSDTFAQLKTDLHRIQRTDGMEWTFTG